VLSGLHDALLALEIPRLIKLSCLQVLGFEWLSRDVSSKKRKGRLGKDGAYLIGFGSFGVKRLENLARELIPVVPRWRV
jgi:hypothetical protein